MYKHVTHVRMHILLVCTYAEVIDNNWIINQSQLALHDDVNDIKLKFSIVLSFI